MNKKYITYLQILGVIIALYLFLVGIKGLSTGIKHLGGDFAKQIMTTTTDKKIKFNFSSSARRYDDTIWIIFIINFF